MQELASFDTPESPEQRKQRRRVRRWKRRARMAGPLLGIPLLLATLTLSVDLIEYDPVPEQKKLTDRPIPEQVLERQRQQPIPISKSVSTASVASSSAFLEQNALNLEDLDDLSLNGQTETGQPNRARNFAPPRPPSALR